MRIGALDVAVTSLDQAVQEICEWVTAEPSKPAKHVHLVNAYTVALADADARYREIFSGEAALCLPDGKPLGWVSILRRDSPRVRQVRGPDFFPSLLDAGRTHALRHFLLGSEEEVLRDLQANVNKRFPGVEIVGTFSPPFRSLTEDELREQDRLVAASRPHIVWVGLGTPKQDYEARRIAFSLGVTCIAVGAAFDFTAGRKNEAPALLRSMGLEWVFRLLSEPRRLWRRYLFGNARFLMSILRAGRGHVRAPRE